MRKSLVVLAIAGLAALAAPPQSDAISLGINPRIAVPTGDFADGAGLGIGIGINYRKEVKGFPGMVSIGLLKFGEKETGPATSNTRTIYVNVGPRYYFKDEESMKLYGKIDLSRQFVNTKTETKVGGRTISTSGNSGSTKLFPGVGLEKGNIGAEVEYDLGNEWLGINLFYTVGGD